MSGFASTARRGTLTSLPLGLVPLDATNDVRLTEEFANLLSENPATPEAEVAYAAV